ncbi:MAG TPA: hypothetical protein VM261_26410 [Kofleriaceae bacterium]|nr:hypothetical protein [Kofleriaceae bacterium]
MTHSRVSALLACALLACGDATSGDTTDAASTSDAAIDGPGAVSGCAPDALDRCDFVPDAPFAVSNPVFVDLSYSDAAGQTRTFQVAVRTPMGAPEPLPVVIWSHGGNDGRINAANVGTEWAAVLAGGGYLVVTIAHAPRDPSSRSALCAALGYDATGCLTFKYLSWDRPHDVRRTLDFVETQAASGPFAGRIDADHIVYAGHSAGAGSVDMVNGASRAIAGTQMIVDDPRPVAFIANSPEPSGDDGFIDASFAGCARPTLINTGVGDDTGDPGAVTIGENRTRVFDLMPPGGKHRLFLLGEAARHSTFDMSPDDCERWSTDRGLDPGQCATYRRWIASSALAFLDAHTRNSGGGAAYLASDNLRILTAGVATWDRR